MLKAIKSTFVIFLMFSIATQAFGNEDRAKEAEIIFLKYQSGQTLTAAEKTLISSLVMEQDVEKNLPTNFTHIDWFNSYNNYSRTQILSDDFSYTDGSLIGNASWVTYGGTTPGQVQVSGGSVLLNDTDSEDVRAEFAPISSGMLYFGLDVQMADPTTYTGTDFEYFVGFSDTSGYSMYGRTDAAAFSATGWSPGVANGSSTAEATWATELDYATTYRIVVGTDISTGISDLWVDPALSTDTKISGTGTTTIAGISGLFFRQGAASPDLNITVDNLVVSDTFSDVITPATTTEGLSEGFEGSFPPMGWTNTATVDIYTWAQSSAYANSGTYSAMFKNSSYATRTAELQTPRLDLTISGTDELNFYLRDVAWGSDQDELWVELSTDGGTSWDTLAYYGVDIPAFALQTLNLETSITQTDNAFIKFTATTHYGYGVYVDDVTGPEVYVASEPPAVAGSPSPADLATAVALDASLGWGAVLGATGYDINFGTDNPPTNIENATDLGDVVVYAPASLAYSTTYYWSITPYNVYGDATGAPVWMFTTEDDPILTPPFTEEFETFTGYPDYSPPANWTKFSGMWADTVVFTTTTSGWIEDDFGNNTDNTKSARLNIYGSSRKHWMVTPPIDLGDGSVAYQAEFDLAYTTYSGTSSATLGVDDTLAVVISTDNGTHWLAANALQIWDSTTPISNTGERIIYDLSGYTGLVKIGFYGHSTASNEDNNAYVDNFTVQVPPTPTSIGMFFSEFIEGSSNNKAFEIYNGTGLAVDLADYLVLGNYNGNPFNDTLKFPVGTMLANGDAYVVAHEYADAAITAVADTLIEDPYGAGTSYIAVFNGDDVRGLFHMSGTDTTLIDLFGLYDLVDPGSGWDVAGVANATKDHTLVRKAAVVQGNTDWTASAGTDATNSEWVVFDQNTFDFIGDHPHNLDPGALCLTANPAVVGTNSATGAPMWFEYTATIDGIITISSCITGQSVDTRLYVYDGCGGTEVAYNDDIYCTEYSYASEVSFAGTAGTSYKLLWSDYWSSSAFDFTILEEALPELPDLLVTSMTLSGDTVDVVVTNQGTADSPGYYGTDYHGLYIDGTYLGYVYESGIALAMGASHTYTLTGFDYYGLGGAGDYEVVFECDTDDDFLELDETNNTDTLMINIVTPPATPVGFMAEGGPGFNELMWGPASDELLPPAPTSNNITGLFERKAQIDKSEFRTTTDEKRAMYGMVETSRAVGDSCENPFTAVTGTNAAPYQPVWYEYTATVNGFITVSSGGSGVDTKVYVYDACGGTYIDYDDDGLGYPPGESELQWVVTAGTTYYINWDDAWSTAAFDWTLTEEAGVLPAPDLTVASAWSSADTVFVQVSNIGTADASSQSAHWFIDGVDIGYTYPAALAPGESDTVGIYGLVYALFGPDTIEVGFEVDFWDYLTELDEENNYGSTDHIIAIPDYLPTYNVYRDGLLLAAALDADDWAFNGYYRDTDVVGGTEYCYYATQMLPDATESEPSNGDCATSAPAGAIEGVVTDIETGLPVPGVEVSVEFEGNEPPRENGFGITDENGYYLAEYIPVGPFTVVFVGEGYHVVHFSVEVADGDTSAQNAVLVPNGLTQASLYYTGFEMTDDAGASGTWAGLNSFAVTDSFVYVADVVYPTEGEYMLTFPDTSGEWYQNNDNAYWVASDAIDLTGLQGGGFRFQYDAYIATENGWDYIYPAFAMSDGFLYWVDEDGMTGFTDGWASFDVDMSWALGMGLESATPGFVFFADGSVDGSSVSGFGGAFDDFDVMYDNFFLAPPADLMAGSFGSDVPLSWNAPPPQGSAEYTLQRVSMSQFAPQAEDVNGTIGVGKGALVTEETNVVYNYSNNTSSRDFVGFNVFRKEWPLGEPELLATVTEPTYVDMGVVDGTYYNYAVASVYDEGESMMAYSDNVRVGFVDQLPAIGYVEDFEGLAGGIPTDWEAFTTNPMGISWVSGDSANADTSGAFGAGAITPDSHTDFAFVSDGRGGDYTFETWLLSPFLDATDAYSMITSFSGYEQGYADMPGNITVAMLMVRAEMGPWHLVTEFSYDHFDGFVDYANTVGPMVAGQQHVQFGFYYFHEGGYNSGGGNGMAVDDLAIYSLDGPTNLVAAPGTNVVDLSWLEPGRSLESLPEAGMLSLDNREALPAEAADFNADRETCFNHAASTAYFWSFTDSLSGVSSIFTFPEGPMELNSAEFDIYFPPAAPIVGSIVQMAVLVANADSAGVTTDTLYSNVESLTAEAYATTYSVDLTGLSWESTGNNFIKVHFRAMTWAENIGGGGTTPAFTPTPMSDDGSAPTGLSGVDSAGVFSPEDYNFSVAICGTPTPPDLSYNIYKDGMLEVPNHEGTLWADENVAPGLEACYFVTGVVPLFVASDAGTMIFVETDPTNTECAMPVNNPPTAFNLMAPANHDTLWIDPNDLGGATMFAWTPSSDPDGAPIEYSIEWNYQELTLVHTLDTTGLAVFVQNVDIFDDIVNGGLAGVTIEWNVSASDGLGETVATNGPFMMHVEALLGVGDEALIPDVFALHQNYPNPFNPTTRIEYDIPEISNVQITIYNVMGQKVRTLVNAEHSPGYHSVLWNGTNEFGSPVSSGMYFYQIKANNFNKVKKLVLMK